MALDGMIFDLDGTLLDTNATHAEAWAEGLAKHGYHIPESRIRPEIGKGGDLLLPTLLGDALAPERSEAIRETVAAAFARLSKRRRFRVFDGVPDLLDALRARGLRLALATSASPDDLELIMESAGTDLRVCFDAVVTKGDVQSSKPRPDVIVAALEKLELSAAQCAMVGDTPFDAAAARRAGVVTLGVASSGLDEERALRHRLLEAGARRVWRDAAALRSALDEALHVASPQRVPLTPELQQRLLADAEVAAREGVAAGETAAGCVLADGDGVVIAWGHDATQGAGHPAAHEVPRALAGAAGRRFDTQDLLLATTREPCVMCIGAAMLAGVDTLFFAREDRAAGGATRVTPADRGTWLPRMVGPSVHRAPAMTSDSPD
jgi:HAD superfamily hydrolase (TIGR01509 family)